jgi:hypothetical protein
MVEDEVKKAWESLRKTKKGKSEEEREEKGDAGTLREPAGGSSNG